MATDLEKLVVQLSADITQYQRSLQNAMGVTNRQARAIESRWKQSEKNLNAIGSGMARGLLAPLAGIGAALTAKEVLSYADAWTKAKNSLAVAGITGATQVAVLDRLYQSAQANATPIGALADLFGKASQASDNLGASNEELIKFSDGVAVALKVAGTGASEASGALTQLGQLLGSARVQAEEFNSVNEGARPILIAVANGLDAAGGSVNRLKQLVNDGKLSGRDFFQAFLKGLPSIQAMAANSTQTIEQGITKVTNAFTKYIGQTDESLSGTQRLAAGLNALADNFDKTADAVLMVAGVIAGALVGRSIALMLAKLPLATAALQAFAVALRAAVTTGGVAAAIGGISAAAGPIGLVVGGVAVAALALFSDAAGRASEGARGYAEALRQAEAAAKAAGAGVTQAAGGLNEAAINSLRQRVKAGEADIVASLAAVRKALNDAFSLDDMQGIDGVQYLSPQQRSELEDLRDRLSSGALSADEARNALYALANSSPSFQRLADGFGPLIEKLGLARAATAALKGQLDALTAPEIQMEGAAAAFLKMRETGQAFIKDAERKAALTKDQFDLEKQIAEVQARAQKAGASLTTKQATDLAKLELAAEDRRKAEGKSTGRADEYDRQTESLRKHVDMLKVEAETLGKSTYEIEKARAAQELLTAAKEAGRVVTPQLAAEIDREADAYARSSAALEEARKKQEAIKDLQSTLGNALVDGIVDMASGAQSLNDILNDTSKMLAKLVLQAALLGQGPLASLFGSSGGGVLGALTSALTGAAGTVGGTTGASYVKAAGGGAVSGPGSSTSDSIPAYLSDGEYVVQAAAAKKNRTLLDAINSGKVARLAGGGPVNMPVLARHVRGAASGAAKVTVNNYAAGDGYEARTQSGGINGEQLVVSIVRKATARGDLDQAQRLRFNVRPPKIGRG